MSETRLADVLDALHDLLAAESYIAGEVTAERAKIFDGPSELDFSADTMLVVGGLPIVDDDSITEVNWDWAAMGVGGQFADIDEWIDVPCGIATVLGDSTNMRAARRTAITMYAKAAEAIRASTLGIPQVMWCTSAISAITQTQTKSGAECLIAFTARIRTRI